MIYCPYTDHELPENETSPEHIVPLSLGGIQGFKIPVDARCNTELGAQLDGPLANEFLMALLRTKYDARGHSGKEPMATIKKASYGTDDRPAQARFHHKKGVSVWDAQDGEYKKGSGAIHIEFSMNIDLPVRFAAKIALAAGYFVYKDLFRKHVDHRQLRDVMRFNPAKADLSKGLAGLGLEHLTLRVDTYLQEPPSDPNSEIFWLRRLCTAVKGSVVALMPGLDCFGVGVGILGQYLAMVNVPANTESFPNCGDYAWGHVLAVVDGKLERYSLLDGLAQLVGV